jgi:hypothetical protein
MLGYRVTVLAEHLKDFSHNPPQYSMAQENVRLESVNHITVSGSMQQRR